MATLQNVCSAWLQSLLVLSFQGLYGNTTECVFSLAPVTVSFKFPGVVWQHYRSQVSGCLLQTAQTWANAGVCSASCAHAFGCMYVCLFVCLFVITCLFVLQAI